MKSQNSEYEVSESFSSTGLNEFICECLCRVGFHKPTPIQYYGIKLCINNPNKNLIARAKSGTGKTLTFAAFVLHYLQMVFKLEAKTYSVIILPTRELAIQVYQLFKTILQGMKSVKCSNEEDRRVKQVLNQIQTSINIGGIPIEQDIRNYGPSHIVVGTIGRINELMNKNILKLQESLLLIFDQGDKIFGNKDPKFVKLLEKLPLASRKLVFSATYTKSIMKDIVKRGNFMYVHTLKKIDGKMDIFMSENPLEFCELKNQEDGEKIQPQNMQLSCIKKFQIKIQTKDQSLFDGKIKHLKNLLTELKYQKCLIFVEKKALLEQISQRISDFDPLLIHGSLSQAARFRMMNRVNKQKIIISSDLLARGIDIQLDLVILFDAKQTDTFWHRIGRTGRYGKTGVAISLDKVEDQEWIDYEKNQINEILGGIEIFNQKTWFGTHMTDATKWMEINQEKEQNSSKKYKYFEEKLTQQKMSMPKKKVKREIFSSVQSKKELQQYIKNVIKCQACRDLMSETTKLTGYKFMILEYLNQ